MAFLCPPHGMDRSMLIRCAADSLVEEQGRHVQLKGPFKRASPARLQSPDLFEVEVEDLFVDSAGFAEAAAGPVGQEHVEDYEGPYHTVLVEAEFSYTTPEPSVGWTGGTELESWEAVALDGVLLMSPEDRKALSAAIEGLIPSHEGDWIRSWDEYQAEAAVDVD